MINNKTIFLSLFIIVMLLSACGPSQADLNATDTQVAMDIYGTQTANAPPATNTPPPPTATDLPTPTDTPAPTETPAPTATPTPDLAATVAFEATQAMDALLEKIDADLQAVNLSTDQGSLAWLGAGPSEITLDTYNTHWWIPLGDDTAFSDFVLRADLTWESTSGLATCGFWFRGQSSDKDSEHYVFEALRLSGLPAWSVEYWKYNYVQSHLTGNPRTSPEINQDQGSTNAYLFIAQGNLLSIYVNGESLGAVTINRLTEGILAFYASQEFGETTCSFDNAWVWDLSE